MLRRVLQTRSPGVPFGLGLLNGLLPCGLVYGMLAKAATTGSASGGALTMAAFGLATLPALALAGALGSRLTPGRRVWMQRASGVLIVALGLLTLSRAALALDPGGARQRRRTGSASRADPASGGGRSRQRPALTASPSRRWR